TDTQPFTDLIKALTLVVKLVSHYAAQLFDSLNVSEDLARGVDLIRLPIDFIIIQDASAGSRNVLRFVSDFMKVAEEASRITEISRQIEELVRAAEATQRIYSTAAAIVEQLLAQDSIQRTYSAFRAVADEFSLLDIQTRILSMLRSIADSINFIFNYIILQTPAEAKGLILAPQFISSSNPFILDAKQLNAYVIIIQIDREAELKITKADATRITPPFGLKFIAEPVDIRLDKPANFIAKVRIFYSEDSLRATGLTPQNLSLYYLDENRRIWIPIQSAVNTEEGYVEAETTHLSIWTIMQKPVKVALFDALIGLGEVYTSIQKWTILPYSEITSAIHLLNMGDEPSMVQVKTWLVDEYGRVVWSRVVEGSVEQGELKTIPLSIVLKEAHRYTLYSQIVSAGVESEPIMRTYYITLFDIYGSTILTAISLAAIASVIYLQRQSRSIPSQKARFNYPM
ncbi:MAG: hypothetical protein QXE57_03860, partial [Nitrososphaerales archaeon]